ncbi:MAG: hypothetical protein AAFR55_00125 [Pseudomonadota bacterium]
MALSDAIQLLISAGEKIDNLWIIFIHIHLAAMALIFVESHKLTGTPDLWRYLMFVAYLMFLFLNYNSLSASYANLDLIYEQLRDLVQPTTRLSAFASSSGLLNENLRDNWIQADYSSRQTFLYLTHGFAMSAVFAGLMRHSTTWQVVGALLGINKRAGVQDSHTDRWRHPSDQRYPAPGE